MRLASIFRSNTSILVFESFAVSLLGFATYAVLLRVTSKETVGAWVLAGSLIAYSRIADMWSSGLTSFVGEERGKADLGAAAAYVTTAVLTGMIGYLLIICLSFPSLYFIAPTLFGDSNAQMIRDILPLMLATFWLQAMAGVYQLGFLGFERPGFKVAQTVGGALVFLASATLLAPEFGLRGILYAQALQGLAMLVFAIAAYHGTIAPKGHRGLSWDKGKLVALVTFGSKLSVVGLFQLSIDPLIRMLVSQFGSLSAVAIVDLAARLIAFVRALCTSLGPMLIPGFAKLGHESQVQRVNHFHEAQRLFLYLGVAGFSALMIGSPVAGTILLGSVDPRLPNFAIILGLGWFVNTLGSPSHFLLVSLRRSRKLLISNIVLSVGTVIFGVAGGFLFGVSGALLGAALALALQALYIMRQSAQALGQPNFGPVFQRESVAFLPLIIATTCLVLLLAWGLDGMAFSELLCWTALGVAILAASLVACFPIRRLLTAMTALDGGGLHS